MKTGTIFYNLVKVVGYVKTESEMRALHRMFASPKFLVEALRVEFETTREFIEEVLPPCLSPSDTPNGLISIGRWQSRACGEFDTASIFVEAKYGTLTGYYNLTMMVSGDMPVIWGREVWGESKKVGSMGLYLNAGLAYAYGERHRTRVIQLEAELGEDEGPSSVQFNSFEIKAYPAADGNGLQYDPLLVILDATSSYSSMRRGTGKITLTGTPHDPVDTIPIVRTGPATFVVGEGDYRVANILPQQDRDAYLPYVYGKNFDALDQYPIAKKYQD